MFEIGYGDLLHPRVDNTAKDDSFGRRTLAQSLCCNFYEIPLSFRNVIYEKRFGLASRLDVQCGSAIKILPLKRTTAEIITGYTLSTVKLH